MNEQNLARNGKEILEATTVRELAMTGGTYTILDELELTPGYNPSSEFTGMSYPNFPIDKYSTTVKLGTGTLISIERTNNPVEAQAMALPEPRGLKKLLSLLGKRESLPAEQKNTEYLFGVHAQVGNAPTPDDVYVYTKSEADVWCSPNELPENLKNHVGSQQEITLSESLFIKPDYSNLPGQEDGKILTTKDYFSIVLKPGAKVIMERGGSIGNIRIHIVEGSLFVPCNPDIVVPHVRRES